jgi:parallel beta-helix repeat protein
MLKRLNSRIRFLTVTICFCAVGLVPIIGHAATYYVDQQKGDDAGPGTQAAPWATIQHAANTMVAGDTVIISPGVYTESVDLSTSGTSEAYITYQALDGAVMESPGSYPTSSFEALDIKANTAYLRFEGFELHGGFDETIFVRPGAHHIEIRHCEIYGNHTGVRWAGSFDGLLEGCQIHDNTGNGVYLSDGAHDITIRNTDSYNNRHYPKL